MPRGDRTGPNGYGPMTGRGMGFCAGFVSPGYTNPGQAWGAGYGRGLGYGRGVGYGRGAGRGWGRGFGRGWGYGPGYAPGYGAAVPNAYPYGATPWSYEPPVEEGLEEEAAFLKDQLDAIKGRLDEIEESRRNKDEGGRGDGGSEGSRKSR